MFSLAFLAAVTTSGPHLPATHVTSAPVLDGRLDEAVWKSAPQTGSFTQKLPADGAPPSEETNVRVLYDDDALYIGVHCAQTRTPIIPRLTRRDRQVESDWVSIDLDTRGDGKSALEFLVNASGVLVDGARSNDVDYSPDWDENWEAKTWVGDGFWSAEIRIPLRILRFARQDVQSWGMQARRYISARQELDEWSYIPRSVAAEVSRYGKLDGLKGLEPRTAFELRPFALLRVRSRDATVDTTGHGIDLMPSGGLDLKWHPSQDLTVDATVNPDFAQVEADQVVLNLSTFEVYKPEKRPFFLEGAELVAPRLGLPLVYTKRIGRNPDLPQLRASERFTEQLVDLPEPGTIYGASKVTGRLSEKVSVGTLSALVGENTVKVQAPNGDRTKRTVEPLTAYNVLRLKRDVGSNGHVGLLMTSVTRAEDTGAYVPSLDTPGRFVCPNQSATVALGERCFHDAYTMGVDARLRQGDWVTSGQVIATAIERGPARTLVDGTRIGAGDVAPAADFYFGKEGGKHVTTWTWFGNAARKVDFNDLGFMWRQNVRYAGGGMEYKTLDPWWETLETHTGFEVSAADNLAGLNIGRNGNVYTGWKFSNFWEARAQAGMNARRYDDREVGDGTALERDRQVWGRLRLISDPRAKVAFNTGVQYGSLPGGAYVASGDATVTWRVLPQLDIEVSPQASLAKGEQRYATDGAITGVHLYAPLEASNVSATLRTIYTFAPRLSLQGYAQAFLANGHYGALSVAPVSGLGTVVRGSDLRPSTEGPSSNPDFQQGAMNVNASFRWEYRLGSILSLVYARTQYPKVVLGQQETGALDFRSIGRAPSVDLFYLKLSYFWG
jgi:hypothetical protein